MKGYEKFESRLQLFGLWEEWCQQGLCGRIATETGEGIIIWVNEGDEDNYSEFKFPPISEMQRCEDFRMRALKEFCYHDDHEFVAKLARWVADIRNKCPLYPVDVYFLWDDAEVINFEDDAEIEVMNTYNAHNAELVERINKAYNANEYDFLQIAELLIRRDWEEFVEKTGDRKRGLEERAFDYCQNVADDKDLETILSYCRM